MKSRALTAGIVAALLAASAATAAPPPTKHATDTCKATVAVVLTGKLAADGAAAPSTLSLTVGGSNAAGKAYRKATQPVSIAVTATTKVVRGGASAKPEQLKSGDRVNVQTKTCKASLAHGATPALTATRVTAHAASS